MIVYRFFLCENRSMSTILNTFSIFTKSLIFRHCIRADVLFGVDVALYGFHNCDKLFGNLVCLFFM